MSKQKYSLTHTGCDTWSGAKWPALLAQTLADEATRLAYD